MIDLHCHILNGVDDGPKELSQSLEMLSAAENAGFTHLVATPHYIHGTDFISKMEENQKKIEVLQGCKGIPRLYLGSELFYDHMGVEHLEEKKASGINGSQYVLIEVPRENMHFSALLDYVFQMEIAGYSIILAHPERYDFIQEDPNYLASLIKRDVLIQMNLNSITGKYGKRVEKTAQIMLDHDMVHIASTDAHKVEDYKECSIALERLNHLVGGKKVEELLMENPSHILSDRVFYPDPPEKIKKKSIFSWIRKK